MSTEYTPTTERRLTVRYVESQPESGPHRPAMPAHWVIEDGLTVVARPVDIHVSDLAARDRAMKAVMKVHPRSDHARSVGFPRADQEEHYCLADQQTWPCPTVRAITEHLPKEADR